MNGAGLESERVSANDQSAPAWLPHRGEEDLPGHSSVRSRCPIRSQLWSHGHNMVSQTPVTKRFSFVPTLGPLFVVQSIADGIGGLDSFKGEECVIPASGPG
jgi:hypothetical protein